MSGREASGGRERGGFGHLARRFAGSLSGRPPTAADEAWAESHLLPGEIALWRALPNQDRRHSAGVARRFQVQLGRPAGRAEMAGALLHDIGKLDSGLGTIGRVVATLVNRTEGDSRFARYRRHEAIGAAMLAEAGSEPVTVALVAGSADAPPDALAALHAADDA